MRPQRPITTLRVSFDIGGVLTKYPEVFKPIIKALQAAQDVEVYFLTDMPKVKDALAMLEMNGIQTPPERIICSPFKRRGESCKAVDCLTKDIHLHIDDFPAYVAAGARVRLLLMPDLGRPYYAKDWKTDGKEGRFGHWVEDEPEAAS
jgi:hypothetical protein